MILTLGQKFLKYDNDNNIKELYRVTSTNIKNFYGVTEIIGNTGRKSIARDVVNKEYKVLNPHCKLHIEIAQLKNGQEDVVISIYNERESYGYPFYICRVGYRDPVTGHLQPGKCCTKALLENNSVEEYEIAYMNLMGDVKELHSKMTIDLYVNDNHSTIIPLIATNTVITEKIFDLLVDRCFDITYKDTPLGGLTKFFDGINFQSYFRANFKIKRIELSFKDRYLTHGQLTRGDIFVLEAAAKAIFLDCIVTEYYHDVNLYDIKSKYMLVEDKNDRLYVVNYIDKNEIQGIYL